jgi:hypothetical protein
MQQPRVEFSAISVFQVCKRPWVNVFDPTPFIPNQRIFSIKWRFDAEAKLGVTVEIFSGKRLLLKQEKFCRA